MVATVHKLDTPAFNFSIKTVPFFGGSIALNLGMKRLSQLGLSLLAVAAIGAAGPLLACQFDPPGMTHEAWLKWVDERNQKNAESSAATQTKLAKEKKNPGQLGPTTPTRPKLYDRRSAGDTPIIRIGR